MRRGTLLVLLACAAVACKSNKGGAGKSAKPEEIVARVGDVEITRDDVQKHIDRLSPFVRARYSAPERKKELLENLVRFEVMAREARARGYDRDPDVQRAVKQQMITQFMQKEFEAKHKPEDVPDAEVEAYFAKHSDEFQRQEEVRVSQIITKDKARAQKAAAEAKAAPAADPKVFRDLVAKYSEDEDSKQRGGDLTFFDRKNTQLPKAVVEAAFTLKEVGDVAGPVQTEKGFHVLKLTQKRPGFSRTLAEVKPEIQRRLYRDVRSKKMDEFIAEMRNKVKVEIFEDQLEKISVEAVAGGPAPGALPAGLPPGAGMPPGAPPPGLPPAALPPPAAPGMPAAPKGAEK